MRKTEQTQWAATCLVAAELTKRGYRVGWPMGNAPTKDLLVESPRGQQGSAGRIAGGHPRGTGAVLVTLVHSVQVAVEQSFSVTIYTKLVLRQGV